MGVTKSQIFTKEQNKIAAIAKVMGHPARVAILQYLLKKKACICGELVDVIGLSQPTISQHLKEMKTIGLITGNIEGVKVCYCIDQKKYSEFQNIFNALFGQDLGKNSNCC